MEAFKRTERVSELLKVEIADIFRKEVNDPRLELVSVTRVHVTSDLKSAHVYISPIKTEAVDSTMECLKKARSFIQRKLGQRLKLRYIPIIEFRLDESIKEGAHILEILEQIKRERREE